MFTFGRSVFVCLFVLFSVGFPQFSSFIRLFQRTSFKRLNNLDLSFPVCKVKILSYRSLCDGVKGM